MKFTLYLKTIFLIFLIISSLFISAVLISSGFTTKSYIREEIVIEDSKLVTSKVTDTNIYTIEHKNNTYYLSKYDEEGLIIKSVELFQYSVNNSSLFVEILLIKDPYVIFYIPFPNSVTISQRSTYFFYFVDLDTKGIKRDTIHVKNGLINPTEIYLELFGDKAKLYFLAKSGGVNSSTIIQLLTRTIALNGSVFSKRNVTLSLDTQVSESMGLTIYGITRYQTNSFFSLFTYNTTGSSFLLFDLQKVDNEDTVLPDTIYSYDCNCTSVNVEQPITNFAFSVSDLNLMIYRDDEHMIDNLATNEVIVSGKQIEKYSIILTRLLSKFKINIYQSTSVGTKGTVLSIDFSSEISRRNLSSIKMIEPMEYDYSSLGFIIFFQIEQDISINLFTPIYQYFFVQHASNFVYILLFSILLGILVNVIRSNSRNTRKGTTLYPDIEE